MAEYDERTEQATPRRRQKAREKGQVARSHELISISTMAGTILMFSVAGTSFMNNLSSLTGRLLGLQYGRDPFNVMRSASVETMMLILPFLAISAVFALFAGVIQGGFIMKPLGFELEKLNPLNGFKKLFSREGLMVFLKSLVKFIIGGVLFYSVIKSIVFILPSTLDMDIVGIKNASYRLIFKIVLWAFGTFFVVAVIDYFYERWRFERSIRMSRDEIREEYKETEGNPLIKSRIRSLQREMARRRMIQEVPKATVVITNPTHLAVALFYKRDDMSAPQVIAKGAGVIAEKIREVARAHHIPIVEDKPLARALYKLRIDSYIPEELYTAVARILAYIFKIRGAA
jgi:flagellar biosynthetic protein FlhB